MPGDSRVRVVLLWPKLLGTYGDGGNARVLAQRCAWRGIASEVVTVATGSPVPAGGDVYLLGGGEDVAQTVAVADRATHAALRAVVERGGSVLAVCAGFQLLGEWFLDGAGNRVDGFGLIDARTDRLAVRAVGEIVAAPVGLPGLATLTGFENHGGATTLGPGEQPLGRVRVGVGNGVGGVDGVVRGGIVGTYLHGPVLARNPALADWLLGRVVGELEPVDDSLVERLRAERLAGGRVAAGRGAGRRRLRRAAG